MKILKRVVALVLVITIFTTMFVGCTSLNPNNIEANLSKGDWIVQLGSYFGMDECLNSENYYQDVKSDSDIFQYVQSCYEWDILEKTEKLEPYEKITKEYALATLVYALGDSINSEMNVDNTSTYEAAKKAVDLGIGQSKSWLYMNTGLTLDEAFQLVLSAVDIFVNKEYEERNNVVYSEGVIVQENTSDMIIDQVDNIITINHETTDYSEGSVVVFGEGADAYAAKITSIQVQDGKTVLSITEPEIDEVFDEIDVSGTGTVKDASDIITADGVTLTSFNGTTLTNNNLDVSATPLGVAQFVEATNTKTIASDLTFSVSVSSGKISGGVSTGSFKGDASYLRMKDHNGQTIANDVWTKYSQNVDLPENIQNSTKIQGAKDTYKGGYTITGTLTIEDFSVSTDVKYKKVLGVPVGIKSYSVDVNDKVSCGLSIEGYLKEDITIAVMPVAIGPLTLQVKIGAYASVSGKIGVTVSVENCTSITYSEKNGYKKVDSSIVNTQPELEVNLEFGCKIELGIGILKIDLVDVSLSVGMKLEITFSIACLALAKEGLWLKGGDEAHLTDSQDVLLMCFDATFSFPIVKVSLNKGKSLAAKLGLGCSWTLVGTGKALKKAESISYHAECENGKFVFKDECTYDSLKTYEYETLEEAKTDEDYDETTAQDVISGVNGLEIDTYAISVNVGDVAEIHIVSLPKGYSAGDLNVSSSDNSVASVSNIVLDIDGAGTGTIYIKGDSAGTATMSIKMKDSNDELKCLVMVNE